jgi:gliding motility-associated-like protein
MDIHNQWQRLLTSWFASSKKLLVLLLVYFGMFSAVTAQNSYVVSNPFPKDFFIKNNGQWNHKDSNIGFILWTGNHNILLSKKQAGFTWEYFQSSGKKKSLQQVEDRIQQVFLNSNPYPEIIVEDSSNFYWTYGLAEWNSKGFKRITYKNVYPSIDVYYITSNNLQLGLLKYGFVLHPGANPNLIQIQYLGANLQAKGRNQHLLKAEHFGLLDSGWVAVQNEKSLKINTQLKNNTLNIHLNSANPVKSKIVIDPYVKVIKNLFDSGLFSGASALNNTNILSQIDYNHNDEVYIMSAAFKYPEIAKYDIDGNLKWIFSGILPQKKWYSSNFEAMYAPGAILVNKLRNTIYFGPGGDARVGPRIIRLNSDGVYDNYISNSRADAPELWDLNLHCKSKTLFASGGSAVGAINIFTVDPYIDSIKARKLLITNDSFTVGQDIIRSVVDKNGNYFSLINYWKEVELKDALGYVYGRTGYWYNGLIWSSDSLNGNYYNTDISKYFKFNEARNAIHHIYINNNRFNGLAVNDSFVFAYDGKALAAIEKLTGKIRCIDSVAWHGGRRGHLGQSGIAADNCNHVFLGGDSANLLVYSFVNNKFSLDTNIYLFSPKKIRKTIDVRFNELTNQLFVAGDSFIASFLNPFASSCSITRTFNVDTLTTSRCKGDFIAHITDGDTNTDYTFQWKNLSAANQPIVQLNSGTKRFHDTLFDPKPGDTLELLVAKNYFCNGEYQKFVFTTGIVNRRDVYDTLCAGDTFAIRQHRVGSDSVFSHSLTNRYLCDSVVTYHVTFKDSSSLSQSVTLCRGDSLKVGVHTYTDAGFYKDTLTNYLGCDSFIYTRFSIAKDTVLIKEHVCNTFFYKVGDSAFYKPGTYTVIMRGSTGCDSVVIAQISMSRDTAVRIRPNICDGDSFMLLGLRYVLPGNYQTHLPRLDGCDSIIRLTLNVRPHHWIEQDSAICFGDSVSVGSNVYKKSGVYTDSLKSLYGCDSVVNTTLVINPKFDTTVVYILCGDSSVVINNNTYSSSANFNFKHKSNAGCDSLVRYRVIKTNLEPNFSIDTAQLPKFTLQDLSIDAKKFIWSFDDGFRDSVNSSITYRFIEADKNHRICLKVTDSVGCLDSICIDIPPSKLTFELYNSFSPNGDGFNDHFVVKSNGEDLQYSMMIFNRWGAKVYDVEKAWTNQPQLFWNGRVMNTGPDCPAGSYFVLYTLYLDGPDAPATNIHGAIKLIR